MTKQRKLPRLTEQIANRVRKAGYDQGRHGKCLICGGSWDDCPHNWGEIALIIQATKMVDVLGIGPK